MKYKVDKATEVKIHIKYKDEKGVLSNIRGSPFVAKFLEDAPPKNNELIGPAIMNYLQQQIHTIDHFFSDTRANITTKGKDLTDDVKTLLRIKDNIQNLHERKEETMLTLDILQELLETLS